jgi:hypothetical protein
MAINYPKFDQKINDQITASRMQQAKTRMATVLQYDSILNQVTVVLESHHSNTIGNIVPNIDCPMVYRNTKCIS